MKIVFRYAESPADYDALWRMWQEVVRQKIYFPYEPDLTRAEYEHSWVTPFTTCVVATQGDEVVGGYILRPNQPGYGNHIANAAYMVDSRYRGNGIGQTLCAHSLEIAPKVGYSALQFNLVVSTNTAAVKAWLANGFAIIGTIPEAFRHAELGLVDAHIMYRKC